MPLSPPVARKPLHTRRITFEGYQRDDGLWDVEGHLTDSKSYGFDNEHRGRIEAGEPIHEMWLRLTVDDDFLVHEIEAVTDAGPFAVCPVITANFQRMVGVRIGPGWRKAVRERVGDVEGCTHLGELLGAMATAAYQTLFPARQRQGKNEPSGKRPPIIGICHAFSSDGEIVRKLWPEHYTGG